MTTVLFNEINYDRTIHDNSPSFKYIVYRLSILTIEDQWICGAFDLNHLIALALWWGTHQEPSGGNRHSCRATQPRGEDLWLCGTLWYSIPPKSSKWFGLLGNASQENEDNHWSFGDPISLTTWVAYQWKTLLPWIPWYMWMFAPADSWYVSSWFPQPLDVQQSHFATGLSVGFHPHDLKIPGSWLFKPGDSHNPSVTPWQPPANLAADKWLEDKVLHKSTN